MNKNKISSEFDRKVVEVLKVIVPNQTMSLKDGEGRYWKSYSVEKEGIAITIIKRNDEVVAKVVYDYGTDEEKTFYGGDEE